MKTILGTAGVVLILCLGGFGYWGQRQDIADLKVQIVLLENQERQTQSNLDRETKNETKNLSVERRTNQKLEKAVYYIIQALTATSPVPDAAPSSLRSSR
jgi:hypothetical protein